MFHRQVITRESFLSALSAAQFGDVAPFLARCCMDCGAGEESVSDGKHEVMGGSVVIGCDGSLLVNPNLLGFNVDVWLDWRHMESENVQEDVPVYADQGIVWRTGAKVRPARPEEYEDGLTGTLVRIALEHDYGVAEATMWVQWHNNTSGPDYHGTGDIVLI